MVAVCGAHLHIVRVQEKTEIEGKLAELELPRKLSPRMGDN
jgi:hypothetical protein